MKKVLTLIAAVALSATAIAQNWKIDGSHTKIRFTTKYLVISDVDGEFKKFEGTFTSSKADWSDLQATMTVQVPSITTDNEMRDKHLLSDDFFNAEKFPTMTFTSTGIKSLGNNKYVLSGNLTVRDVTKKVEVPLVYGGQVKDPWGNLKAGFKATGKINRKDFGLKYANAAATGEAVVGDEVEFTIDAVLIKQ
ncbi:MAG: polyisoprenoid-binding protein [Bacteroidia bacterium]|jgi:polyisoprenoid-binding protein YceI|nr:polyisoprenoid-binding protein [Bacteroidia bacterium]MBP7436184.1 polyisoprenoid-binding protein [Bacteroidia bacterium]MBP7728125.1 polyisoprenoid-binding protein [Bacteroidia bacterium]MBP7771306.1 polyisoprenoid-binding protein [Bacteroidia bacterium]